MQPQHCFVYGLATESEYSVFLLSRSRAPHGMSRRMQAHCAIKPPVFVAVINIDLILIGRRKISKIVLTETTPS